jgi:response regulator RpfG family c-di-GMP phosphodiesterase
MSFQPTVLCVDDEPFVVASLSRLLRHEYNVITATSGEQALQIVMQQRIDVLVSDQRMPGMKGVDLLKRVRDVSPATMRILLTGYADLNAIVDSVNEGEVFRYITKPWKNEVLRYTVNIAAKASLETAQEAQRIAKAPAVSLDLSSGDPTKDVDLVDVLIIDTDVSFHELVRRAISHKGRLFHASSMEDALRILEVQPNIGVIISETRVGHEDVTDLVATLKAYHPSITTIVASSYTDANVVIKLINQGQIYRFIPKPTQEARVEELVARAGRMHKSLSGSQQLTRRYQVESAVADDAPNAVPVMLENGPDSGQGSSTGSYPAQPQYAPPPAYGAPTAPPPAYAPPPPYGTPTAAPPAYAPPPTYGAPAAPPPTYAPPPDFTPAPKYLAPTGLVSRIRALLFKKK